MRRIRILILTLLILGAISILIVPPVLREIALPDASARLDSAVANLGRLSVALRDYELKHAGKRPSSFHDLKAYAMVQFCGSDFEQEELAAAQYQYIPYAQGLQPVIACYISYPTKDAIVWLDGTGAVYASCCWTWPTWRFKSGHLRPITDVGVSGSSFPKSQVAQPNGK